MKKVNYKGKAYRCKVMGVPGNRMYSLYNEEGLLVHFVEEQQLDKPSMVISILMAYYRSLVEEPAAMFR